MDADSEGLRQLYCHNAIIYLSNLTSLPGAACQILMAFINEALSVSGQRSVLNCCCARLLRSRHQAARCTRPHGAADPGGSTFTKHVCAN